MTSQDTWDIRFMRIALEVSKWSSCLKSDRHIGAVITKNRRILTTGYNGAPSGIMTCVARNECIRKSQHIESGTQHEKCYAIHAEQNAILQAAKLGISVDESTIYCTHQPCSLCAKAIINAGIKRVVYLYDYPDSFATMLLREANIAIRQLSNEVMR